MARTTRRRPMGEIGTATLAGGDAELVTLCGQFMALQAKLDAMGATTVPVRTEGPEYGPDRDDVVNGLTGGQADILDKMHDLTATTLAGHRGSRHGVR